MLAAAIVVWTAIAWGGRIGLLTGGENLWAWARIAGSIAIALIAGAALVFRLPSRWRNRTLVVFVAWTIFLWSRSLVVNWIGSGSLSFKLVHTVLGAGFLALAWWAWNERQRDSNEEGAESVG